MKTQSQGLRRGTKALLIALLLLALLLFMLYLYSTVYYKPNVVAQAARASAEEQGLLVETKDYIAIGDPAGMELGYIFYPGGKVDAEAYLPYLLELYMYEGVFCAVVKPPLHLAILGVNQADEVMADYPEIGRWAVGGHSLGGSAAARYAAAHDGELAGLVLLASYPDVDLSASKLPALSITAGQDRILDWEKYEAAKSLMPTYTLEFQITGGDHGQFGSYGYHAGDGRAQASPSTQRETAVGYTGAFLRGEIVLGEGA